MRRNRRTVWTASVLALAMGLSACAASDFTAIGPTPDEAGYAALYPLYAELCAVSSVGKKPGFGPSIDGGPGGHTVVYLHGACRDRGAGYPVLRLCDPARPDDPDGVGLSANAHFSNANWIATDGRDFLFDGTLKPGERLTRAKYAETQAAAKRMGLLDGITFHDEVFADMPAGVSRRDFMYDMSVSTDYAIAFGRGRDCARVPVTRAQMLRMVASLNALNAEYRNGPKTYVWNVLQDNCAHFTHNVLAAAGIWDEWRINQFVLLAALSFPVPKNEFVKLMHRTNDGPLRPAALFRDAATRTALMHDGWLPTEPGALAESAPVWPDNDLYGTGQTLIFYDEPVFETFQVQFDRITAEPRYHDLRANLQHFAAEYDRLRAERRPLAWWQAAHPALARSPDGFPAFYARFYDYVDGQSRRVDAALAALPAATPPAAEPAAAPVAAGSPSAPPGSGRRTPS
jgi:hypothetical protein